MPGPQPNPNAQRRNNKTDWRTLPAVCEQDAPSWPLSRPVDADRAEALTERWADLWRMPQAVIWHEQATRYVVARYLQLVLSAEGLVEDGEGEGVGYDLKVAAEVRQLEDRLLINPDKFIRARLLVGSPGDEDGLDDDGDDGEFEGVVLTMLG